MNNGHSSEGYELLVVLCCLVLFCSRSFRDHIVLHDTVQKVPTVYALVLYCTYRYCWEPAGEQYTPRPSEMQSVSQSRVFLLFVIRSALFDV